ncbi:glycosyltransferase family 4 protein [Oryzomonas sagensis]|nr:glycosyltransferase family 1 protein [Oryzomonas sagensis]
MKIVINAFSARRGGGQTYLLNLLQYLEDCSGLDIFIFCPDTLRFPDHPAVKRLTTSWPIENPLLRALWEKFVLSKILKEIDADILFCPGGLINTRAPKRCKTVTMFRNMIPFDMSVRQKYPLGLMRIRNWLLEHSMLSSMMKADMVIFISEFARKVIEEKSHGHLRKAVTIPHGINDHFKIDNLPSKPKWLPDCEYLLYVSIFDVYKNQMEVVRGYHLLKSRREMKEKLILAGHCTAAYALKVMEEIQRLGLKNDVILTGNIAYQELPAAYAHAKINIFASTCENCPNILLEAMGAGRPLLISGIQPMPEFGGEAAVYFDPFDPEDFARQIMSIIDAPEELDRLGRMVAKRAEKYDWKETAHRTWQAIRELALSGK